MQVSQGARHRGRSGTEDEASWHQPTKARSSPRGTFLSVFRLHTWMGLAGCQTSLHRQGERSQTGGKWGGPAWSKAAAGGLPRCGPACTSIFITPLGAWSHLCIRNLPGG